MSSKFRLRPKSDYLQKASWQELYVLTEHWKSDMSFYHDELRFLYQLVNKYFVLLIKDENIHTTQQVVTEICNLSQKSESIHDNIILHLHHLEACINETTDSDEVKFRKEHEQLEEDMIAFTRTFWKVKKEVFAIMEQVMAHDKLQHLIA